ncbi:MAG TPA: MBL fold metallo-hydrolase [Burkholderiaceae bacterium]|jgi:glyoxylase-like metal-dependent hydrolase (beta-lactamase superfamily II)|nr:MBL fold metallo-hydrolase [Burkholderiaceae bacterium]HMM53056.1 MBL fold metallo-hydrolase [Burkholderiaceae bacterium]
MTDPVRRLDFGRVSVFFGEKSGKYPDGNQVIVRGSDTRVAFDTPLVANRIGPELDDAELVLLGHAHEDHMAGLHRLPKAAVQVHELDLDAVRSWEGLLRHYGLSTPVAAPMLEKIRREFFYVPRPDATPFRDGKAWDLGGARVRAIHMPGHTSGHSVLLVESEGVAFLGDIDLSGFGPYYGDATSSLAAFRRTLARVAELPATVWVTSHHRGVYTDRAAFLKALAAFAAKLDERSEQLLAMLLDGPKTLEELVAIRLIYPPDYEEVWIDDAERRTIGQHLDELIAAGRVRTDGEGRFARC